MATVAQMIGGSVFEAVDAALRSQVHSVDRLVYAQTSVTFELEGEPDVTLLLDRSPVELATGDVRGEVVVSLDRTQAAAFGRGQLPMTEAIVTGRVAASGPVRRYLEVDPILRSLLAAVDDHAGVPVAASAPAQARLGAPIDPELLAIETRDLHKAFGPHKILEGLDLRVPEGVISVVLGPSGTGKSVCLNHILGLLQPDSGEVLIRGRSLSSLSRAEMQEQRRDIGVMFQDGALFSTMSVYDNVAFPLRQHTDFEEDDVHELVMEQLESVGLAQARHRMPNELSGGMRKRAGLARALVMNPGIVLCDEPDSGLDPVRTALLGDVLVERHADHGGTMLIVTHNILLAKVVADHISVIWRGKVLEDGMSEQILNSDSEFIRQFMAGEPHGPLTMDS